MPVFLSRLTGRPRLVRGISHDANLWKVLTHQPCGGRLLLFRWLRARSPKPQWRPRRHRRPAFQSPFVFADGRTSRSFNELALACQEEWPAAGDMLQQGFFETFFKSIGRVDLVVAAREAAKFPDRDRGLDQLLAKFPGDVLEAPRFPARRPARHQPRHTRVRRGTLLHAARGEPGDAAAVRHGQCRGRLAGAGRASRVGRKALSAHARTARPRAGSRRPPARRPEAARSAYPRRVQCSIRHGCGAL